MVHMCTFPQLKKRESIDKQHTRRRVGLILMALILLKVHCRRGMALMLLKTNHKRRMVLVVPPQCVTGSVRDSLAPCECTIVFFFAYPYTNNTQELGSM